jgi:tRNA 2-thiouridine synthesizing protein A
MSKIKPDEVINLEGVPCPQNSARSLLKLESMDSGEILEIVVDDGEPIANVPISLEDEGFKILQTNKTNDDKWHLFVKIP